MPIGALRPQLRMAAASDPVLRSVHAFEKLTQTERGRPSSNRAKSMQDFLLRAWRVSPCTTRSRGARRAPHISCGVISQFGTSPTGWSWVFQNGTTTHPTNPEVAPCQNRLFGLRCWLYMPKVFEPNLGGQLSCLRRLFLGQARLGAPVHALSYLVPLASSSSVPTRPISTSVNIDFADPGLLPFDSPQRARHDSGVITPERIRTR